MGINVFDIDKSTSTLRWEEGPYVDVVVVCRAVGSLGLVQELISPQDDIDARIERNRRFGREVLMSWNLDDVNGNSIPATEEGMISIPPQVAFDIEMKWLNTEVDVPAPLEPASSNGDISSSTNSDPGSTQEPAKSSALQPVSGRRRTKF